MFSVFRTCTSILATACFAATAAFADSRTNPPTAFRMAVAESLDSESSLAEYYKTNGFSPIWAGQTVANLGYEERRALAGPAKAAIGAAAAALIPQR